MIPVPKTFDEAVHDISYEWSGAVISSDISSLGPQRYYVESYVTWTAHHENNLGMKYDGDAWNDVVLPLDAYRIAVKQDEIDTTILGMATTQADYAEYDDTIAHFRLPDALVHAVANPAYIQNRPWTGVAIADSGEFSSTPFNYAKWLVDGGDFTGIAGTIPGYLPSPIPSTQQFKNVIFKVWRGLYAEMPEIVKPSVGVWNNFANTLRWCTDRSELWYSDGSILHLVNASFKVAYPSESWEWIRTQPGGGGHFYWDSATKHLRFNGPNEDTQTGIVWQHYTVQKGGPNFTETTPQDTNLGVRLSTAWSEAETTAAGPVPAMLRIYYTKNKDTYTYTPEDEIITVGDLKAHTDLTNNPHQVTKAQVGLEDVENYKTEDFPVSKPVQEAINKAALASQTWLPSVLTKAELPTEVPDPDVTYLCRVIADTETANNGVYQWVIGATGWTYYSDNADFITKYELDQAIDVVEDALTAHTGSETNPHKVTATQVGLDAVNNTADTDKPVSTAQKSAMDAISGIMYEHMKDKKNPHGVTKAQVDLADVDNTSDLDKPVSTATQNAINAAKLGGQTWLSSVQTREDLEAKDIPDPAVNYLCSVTNDEKPTNNGVWQHIANSTEWTYYSSGRDFVTILELNGAINGVVTLLDEHKDWEDNPNPHKVTATQVGLGLVDNTADASKPVSTAQKNYVDTEVGTVTSAISTHVGKTDNPHSVTATQVGLGNVDNTSDMSKPVSREQKTAIDKKVDIAIFDDTHGAVVADMGIEPLENQLAKIVKVLKNAATGANFVVNVNVKTTMLNSTFAAVDDHTYDLTLNIADGAVNTTQLANGGVTATKLQLDPDVDDAISKDTFGLSNVDNTSDMDKPVSTATQTAIEDASLATQTWLAAVDKKSDLPVKPPNPKQVYLCRVMHDTTAKNNGVYQWVPDSTLADEGKWTLFSDNVDFIDETELNAAIDEAAQTQLADQAGAEALPPVDKKYHWYDLLQATRNTLKWLGENKQGNLSRTVTTADNATAAITDTGGNLSIPVPLTTEAPTTAGSATQTTKSTGSLRDKFKVLVENIQYLFKNKQATLVSGTNIKSIGDSTTNITLLPPDTTDTKVILKTINSTSLLGAGNIQAAPFYDASLNDWLDMSTNAPQTLTATITQLITALGGASMGRIYIYDYNNGNTGLLGAHESFAYFSVIMDKADDATGSYSGPKIRALSAVTTLPSKNANWRLSSVALNTNDDKVIMTFVDYGSSATVKSNRIHVAGLGGLYP
jgi:hypothetical protein